MTIGNFGSFAEIVLPSVGIDLAQYTAPLGPLQVYHKYWFFFERITLSRPMNPTLTIETSGRHPAIWLERLLNGLMSAGVIPKWLPGKPGKVYIEYNITEEEKTILRNSIENFSVDDMFPSV